MPEIVSEKKIPSLEIDNYEYKLKINHEEFICYNWADKKLMFGKGYLKNYDGKEIKFIDEEKVKSIYVGVIENGKYSKHGFYVDENDHYEG